MRDLRALTAAGSLLVVLGCAVGWFERAAADLVDGPVTVVRPDGVFGLGVLAWLLLVPVVVAPFVPSSRRVVLATLAAVAPGVVLVLIASALPRRTVVSGETIGELVSERTLGQALSVAGALVLLMALAAGWRRAPDWGIPPRWWQTTVTDR